MNFEVICNGAEAVLSAGVYTAAAVMFLRTVPENVPSRETWCRSRWTGLLLTLPAALRCVPLAFPVSPDFLLPLLWPLAVVLPVLCFFWIDAYAARGLAFWLIVAAYGQIHTAFDLDMPGTAAVAAVGWLAGIAGIWISAKPYLLRDLFRAAAVRRSVCYAVAGGFLAAALTALYIFIQLIRLGGLQR